MKLLKPFDYIRVLTVMVVCYGMTVDTVLASDITLRASALATNANRYVTLKNMPASELEPLRAALRDRISSGRMRLDTEAHELLIEMGDKQTLEETRQVYEGNSPSASFAMQRQLQNSAQPAVIPVVAVDLFRDEPAKMVSLNSEFFDYPLSVRSAEIIRNVLTNSPEFPEDVRRWAAKFNLRETDQMRNAIREWWQVNRNQVEKRNYGAITPVNLTNQPPKNASSPVGVAPRK